MNQHPILTYLKELTKYKPLVKIIRTKMKGRYKWHVTMEMDSTNLFAEDHNLEMCLGQLLLLVKSNEPPPRN